MADGNQNQDWPGAERDELDRKLSAALAKFAAVEPRAGLEDRVLANLRAEREQVADRLWWRWGLAAVAAVVVVALALASRSGKPSHLVVANHPSPTMRSPQQSGYREVTIENHSGVRVQDLRPAQRKTTHRSRPTVVADEPKLDQFPSPQPLSEQERILASYVAQYPEHAVLVARAQAEALREDQEEEMRESGTRRNNDLQEQNP